MTKTKYQHIRNAIHKTRSRMFANLSPFLGTMSVHGYMLTVVELMNEQNSFTMDIFLVKSTYFIIFNFFTSLSLVAQSYYFFYLG